MSGSYDVYPYYDFNTELWEDVGMAGAAGLLGIILAVYFLIIFASFAFSVVSYILHSLGLYTIANRRGVHHSWLAWIPFGNVWLLGSISDQYQYVAKGKVRNRRKVLLWLYIALALVYVAWFVLMLVGVISQPDNVAAGAGVVAGIIVGALAIMALAIVMAVFQYVAYNDLFASCNPNNATLFLVLSIVFQVTLPFFVFACRKKDGGMPPRKQPVAPEAPVQIPEDTYEEPEETAAEEGFAQPEEFEEE